MASLLEEDVCDDVFWLEILPLLNLKDYMALASTSTTMRRRCLAESRPKLPIPVRDLYKLLAPVTDEEARKFRQGQDSSLTTCSLAKCKCRFMWAQDVILWGWALLDRLRERWTRQKSSNRVAEWEAWCALGYSDILKIPWVPEQSLRIWHPSMYGTTTDEYIIFPPRELGEDCKTLFSASSLNVITHLCGVTQSRTTKTGPYKRKIPSFVPRE